MQRVFAPGCALMIYKPHLAKKIQEFLNKDLNNINEHLICCRHEPRLPLDTQVINVCPGCDKRFTELYAGITTISLWELLATNNNFPFPNYQGKKMAILDACPTRDQDRVHNAIRSLLKKMNVDVVEPVNTRKQGICCGDRFYGLLPVEKVKKQMEKRANEMPVEDVVVYCVSCCKSMFIGGKKPHYMVDLLFNEETIAKTYEPDEWHAEIDKFIDAH